MNELEREIEQLRYELSVTIPEELKAASASGDLLENGEYSEIISRQNLLSIRLGQLTRRLYAMRHINLQSISRTAIGIGSIVYLQCNKTGTLYTVKLVSSEISTEIPTIEEITVNSPFGKAVLNKAINDNVSVYTPSGVNKYTIIHFTTIHDT
jgi:transcription elongation GreA/GreB family factor